ncbi:hypothetical protein [Streptomyces sp. NPDC085596]|uniref:hypothetical protein n=1 Tax=Streptomyces sp. NPDC085596 TaxID=3365731 RepID=UPI0037CF29B8
MNDWPESVIARYLTVGGATVDITHTSHSGYVVATCNGCGNDHDIPTNGRLDDTPEEQERRVDQVLPDARDWAQDHAETCRAMPRPAASR